jgi:hypothetical protein
VPRRRLAVRMPELPLPCQRQPPATVQRHRRPREHHARANATRERAGRWPWAAFAHWVGVAMGRLRCTVPVGCMHCVQLGCQESAQLPFLFFNFSSLDSNMLQTSKICRDFDSS